MPCPSKTFSDRLGNIQRVCDRAEYNKLQRGNIMIPDAVKVIIDFTLGDGWLGYGNGVKNEDNANPKMRIEHSIKQADYAKHKESILYQYGFTAKAGIWAPKTGKNMGKEYYRIDVHTNPLLKTAYKWTYNKKRKALDRALLRNIDAKTLAYWFMDDGTAKLTHYNQKKDHRVMYELPKIGQYVYCTDNFTEQECLLFIDCLKERFNIRAILIKHSSTSPIRRVAIGEIEDKNKFRYLVEPYIIPSMYYKIAYPHSFSGIPFTKECYSGERLSEKG